jgi:hypothetical protein
MLAGLHVKFVGTGVAGASRVSENVLEVPFRVTVIPAGVLELTGDGVTVKLAVVEPARTVAEAGTEAEPLLLDSPTTVLVVGAALSVTVQVDVAGAAMLAGLHIKFVGAKRAGWLMTTVAPPAVTATGLPLPLDPDAPMSVTADEVAVVLPKI